MNSIGFVLITHSKPHQIKRLVERLNSMFDFPPIVMHHDFGKCSLTEDFLPDNVSFVRPYVNTSWGRFSIVEATLLGFAQMYHQANAPDWCVLLSGADYPTKPAPQILEDLMTGGYDAHINGRKVDVGSIATDWHRERYRRYCVKQFDIPILSLDRRLRTKIRVVHLPRLPRAIEMRLLPFSENFQCYAGAHWFTASRRAVEYLLDFQKTPQNTALSNHYKEVKFHRDERFPEESYFQTVFYNALKLNLNFNNWLYLDWSEQKAHPKSLTLADLPAIQASPMHFARKVDIDTDSDLLDALDRIIDVRPDGRVSSEAAGALRG